MKLAHCPEAVMFATGDDDMVYETYIEETCRRRHTLGEIPILLAGTGTSRRMVMYQDYLRGKQLQSSPDNKFAIYHRSLHTTLT